MADYVRTTVYFLVPIQYRYFAPLTYSRPSATAGEAALPSFRSLVPSTSYFGPTANTTLLPPLAQYRRLSADRIGLADEITPFGRRSLKTRSPVARLKHFSTPGLCAR